MPSLISLARLPSLACSARAIFLVLLHLLHAPSSAAQLPDLRQSLDAYVEIDAEIFYGPGTSLAKATRHTQFYDAHFGKYLQHGDIAALGPAELQFHFDALSRVVTYTHDPAQVALMQQVFNRMLALKIKRPENYRTLYRALLAIRNFDAAAAFLAAHPPRSTEPLPRIVPFAENPRSAQTEWIADPVERKLSRVRFEMPMGPFVVVFSNPECRFSRTAIDVIHADKALREQFAGRSKFLMPPDSNFSFDRLQAWNREHDDATMSMVHSLYEWPELEEWSTPVFYFFRDRKLVTVVNGWPPEGNVAAVKSALAVIGAP